MKGIFSMLMLLAVAGVFGQADISGTVTSASDNAPLPGATIVELGTTNGVVSDLDGNYTITVSGTDAKRGAHYRPRDPTCRTSMDTGRKSRRR